MQNNSTHLSNNSSKKTGSNSIFSWSVGLILLLGLAFVQPSPTQIQASTTPFEATASTTTNASLKERIQKVVKENSEKIKGVIDNLSQKKRGFIGQVERVTAESVTVRTIKGTEILSIDENLELTKAGKDIDPDDIAIGDWMTVLGLEDNNTFMPIRIQVSSNTIRPKQYQVQLGSITSVTSSKITISNRADATELSFDLNRTTQYQDLSGEKITASQLDEDAQVLILGYQAEDGNIATIVRSLTTIVEEN